MSANIIAFPHTGSSNSASFKKAANRGLHLIAHSETLQNASGASQALANRIVAQIEREIANRAYARAQNRLNPQPIVMKTPAETPVSVARRILHALKSFAYSA